MQLVVNSTKRSLAAPPASRLAITTKPYAATPLPLVHRLLESKLKPSWSLSETHLFTALCSSHNTYRAAPCRRATELPSWTPFGSSLLPCAQPERHRCCCRQWKPKKKKTCPLDFMFGWFFIFFCYYMVGI